MDASPADIGSTLASNQHSMVENVVYSFSQAVALSASDFTIAGYQGTPNSLAPTIPESELATRKGEVITLLRQDEDNPAVRAVEALMELLYGPAHPYGRRQKGTVESVEQITRDQLLSLHAARFAPGV